VDDVESSAGRVDGLGLLDVTVEFAPAKTLRRFQGSGEGEAVDGDEIHHGRVTATAEQPWLTDQEAGPEGAQQGAVFGSHVHGLLESDAFRRSFLLRVAAAAGKPGFTPAPGLDVSAVRTAQLDLMADLVTDHLDMAAVERLLTDGAGDPPTVLSWLSGESP